MHTLTTSRAKLTASFLLLLALSVFVVAPAAATVPAGSYHAYLIAGTIPYADTLTFTADVGDPNEGTVTSAILGNGRFHYSTSEDLVLMLFGISLFQPSDFAFAGRLVNGQWQGVMSINGSTGGEWIAQPGPFAAPLSYGTSIAIAKDAANPNGRIYSGIEWQDYGTVPLTFKLTNGVSGAGRVENFGTHPSATLSGHFWTSVYTDINEQLFVLSVQGKRVYGGVVRQLSSGQIELEGAWYRSDGFSGTFLVTD